MSALKFLLHLNDSFFASFQQRCDVILGLGSLWQAFSLMAPHISIQSWEHTGGSSPQMLPLACLYVSAALPSSPATLCVCVACVALSLQHHRARALPPRGAPLSGPDGELCTSDLIPQSPAPRCAAWRSPSSPDPPKPLTPAATLIRRLIMIARRCNV